MPAAFDYRSSPPPADMASLKQLLEGLNRSLGAPASTLDSSVSSGFTQLDALLPGGGFPIGRLTELSGAAGSGKLTLSLSALAERLLQSEPAALIDATRSVLPPVTTEPLYEDLLVVRAETPKLAFQALDTLLRTRAFPLIVIDLSDLWVAPNAALGTRISREARVAETALLILSEISEPPLFASLATLRLTVESRPGALKLCVAKNKLGAPGAELLLPLGDSVLVDPQTTNTNPIPSQLRGA